ncbi:hypothetical protein MSPP1_004008 [Malassezia sp. CBS 17886]|nr:hypothetical protein MSPP1_004008 [Malassezia sp. CBS 17886]
MPPPVDSARGADEDVGMRAYTVLPRVVRDYLVHAGYTDTAAAFARGSAHGDAALRQAEDGGDNVPLRRRICDSLSAGDIRDALALCDAHFPGVLSAEPVEVSATPPSAAGASGDGIPTYPISLDPFHVWLNVHMQLFVELVRQLFKADAAGGDTEPLLQSALHEIHTLNTRAQMLPGTARERYLHELDRMVPLLAYRRAADVPDGSFFDCTRRAALAAQVNSAILASLGQRTQPLLACLAKQTTFTWGLLHERKVPVPREHPVVTSGDYMDAGGRLPADASPDTGAAQAPRPSRTHAGKPGAAAAPDTKSSAGIVLPPWDLGAFAEQCTE